MTPCLVLVIAQGAIYIYEVVYSIIIEEGVFFYCIWWHGRAGLPQREFIALTSYLTIMTTTPYITGIN